MVGAGLGALLGSTRKKVIIIDDDGVYFVDAELQKEWADVVNVEVGEDEIFCFQFRGGLRVYVDDDNIEWREDGYREYFTGEESDEEIDISLCEDLDTTDFEIDNNIEAKDFEKILRAIESVLWANELAETLGGAKGVYIDQRMLFAAASVGYGLIRQVSALEGFGRSQKRKQIISRKSEIASLIKEQLNRIDPTDDGCRQIIAGLFACVGSEVKEGIDGQAIAYDNLRNARAYGSEDIDADMLTEILTAEEDGMKPLGGKEWFNRRKMIVCTDEKASLSIWSEGVKIPGTMVMDAQDIFAYNDAVSGDMKLKFEQNHPQNGVTYIQHPMRKNVYIDLDSFHDNLLREKFEEFKKILEALGAVSITCKVTRSDSADKKQREKRTAGAEVDITAVGEGSGRYEHSDASTRMLAIFEEMETEIVYEKPTAKPHLPDGLIFYPFETAWQNLASSVLNGRRKEENTTLTYRSDYAVTGQRLTSIEGKLKSLVPGYQFGVGGNFAQEFEQELKQLKSTVWHYHVCFDNPKLEAGAGGKRAGKRAEKQIVQSQAIKSDKMSCVSTQKNVQEMGGCCKSAERETVLKRVRRLAQSDNVRKTGLFSDEQRAAIESFAAKKGICDDVDDLIEEALG